MQVNENEKMAKKVYEQTVNKWGIVNGVSAVTFAGLFLFYFFTLGAITITGYSGDQICAGTIVDPCYAYINFTAEEDIFIYPVGYDPWGRDTPFEFSPGIESWKLQRSWGKGWRDIPLDKTCTGTWCGAPNNQGVKYSYVLRDKKDYQFRIVAYKNNPKDVIKWAVNYEDREYLDPSWLGVNDPIGYEFLDNNSVVHIWNEIDDYFFEKDAGIQLTNHYDDYWTKNIFCIGYYTGDNWNKISCSDELNDFNKSIESDNLTYVNATLWKDISYGSYDLRLGVQYYLGVNDTNLSVKVYGKNIGIDIPFDLGFAWKIKDVNIPGIGEDYIDINETSYNLNGSYNLIFKNMNESYFNIHDITKFLRLDWDENLNYAVKLYGDGNQSNFYVSTLINAGHFNPGQEKSTTFKWIDADTAVNSNVVTNQYAYDIFGPYWSDNLTAIIIMIDPNLDIAYERTTDGGATWNNAVIQGGTTKCYAAWFDKETPGDTGDKVNIMWMDSVATDLLYVNIDVATNTVGTIRIVDNDITASSTVVNNRVAITKTVSGNLIASVTTQLDMMSYKSDDLFATSATNISNPFEIATQEDWLLLYSANTGDDNDAAGVFLDGDADAISLKMYDDSADSWTETAIGSMSYSKTYINYDASVRHSDNHILLTFILNSVISASNELHSWDLTPDSIASPTVTQKTTVETASAGDEMQQTAVLINQQNDDVYVAYIEGSDYTSAVSVFYELSTTDMGSWGGQQAYSEAAEDDNRALHLGRSVDNSGGRMQIAWVNDDLDDIFVNLVNDININGTDAAPSDTCDYSSGNWNVNCFDNCSIESNVDLGGNNLNFNGTGIFQVKANITNYGSLNFGDPSEVCQMIFDDGTYLW